MLPSRALRRAGVAVLLAGLLLISACGGTQAPAAPTSPPPVPKTALERAVPDSSPRPPQSGLPIAHSPPNLGRTWRIGVAAMTPEGRAVEPAVLAGIDRLKAAFPDFFATQTRGRGSVQMDLPTLVLTYDRDDLLEGRADAPTFLPRAARGYFAQGGDPEVDFLFLVAPTQGGGGVAYQPTVAGANRSIGVGGIGLRIGTRYEDEGLAPRLRGVVTLRGCLIACPGVDVSSHSILTAVLHAFTSAWVRDVFAPWDAQDPQVVPHSSLIREGRLTPWLFGCSVSGVGFDWLDNGDGTYSARTCANPDLSDLELYLMGLLAEGELGEVRVIEAGASGVRPQQAGRYRATVRAIEAAELVAANGPRFELSHRDLGETYVPAPLPSARPETGAALALGVSRLPEMRPGEVRRAWATFENLGPEWVNGRVDAEVSLVVCDNDVAPDALNMSYGWLSNTRVARPLQAVVGPHAVAIFAFTVRAPAAPGAYPVALCLHHNTLGWLRHDPLTLAVVVVDD